MSNVVARKPDDIIINDQKFFQLPPLTKSNNFIWKDNGSITIDGTICGFTIGTPGPDQGLILNNDVSTITFHTVDEGVQQEIMRVESHEYITVDSPAGELTFNGEDTIIQAPQTEPLEIDYTALVVPLVRQVFTEEQLPDIVQKAFNEFIDSKINKSLKTRIVEKLINVITKYFK